MVHYLYEFLGFSADPVLKKLLIEFFFDGPHLDTRGTIVVRPTKTQE